MKKTAVLILCILASGILAQDLILTSDTSIEIQIDNGQEFLESLKTDVGNLHTEGLTQIFPAKMMDIAGPAVEIMPQVGLDKKVELASFGEPGPEALAQKKTMKIQPVSYSSELQSQESAKNLASAKWIYGGSRRFLSFVTPCFHNPCPNSEFTLYFSSTCSFTVHLIDPSGNIVQTIGSGVGWASYIFRFFTPCGKYRLRFVLNCSCICPHIRFNLYQNRKDCFTCPDDFRHAYNPTTCKCECANRCACSRPQTWYDFPSCGCGCPWRPLPCPANKFYNKKTCQCECLPKCCTLVSVTNRDCLCLPVMPFAVDKTKISDSNPN